MNPFTRNLSSGSMGLQVIDLQNTLEKLGYGDFLPTGYYGLKTQNAVANFQKKNGISPAVGNFGEKTRQRMNLMMFPRQIVLWTTAKSLLGVDASPLDRADDEYGCADTVNCIALAALGFELGGTVSTTEMAKVLRSSPMYEKTDKPKEGTIIISATEGHTVGHVGIMLDGYRIMSNSSSTGLWSQNYDIDAWKRRYQKLLGLKVEFFNLK